MKLKRLMLRNIRSYKNEEIIFPEGSILLIGDIGSGKTTILLAIEYALFGLQPGQRGSSLLRNNTNNGSVLLEFEIQEKNILIERKLKRNHKTVTNEYSAITINNEKLAASLTETKLKILGCMGYPNEFIKKNNLLYRYTVYTPQEQMKQIIIEDPETRRNILRHILGIDKYKRIQENLSILLNKLREESNLLQGEIKDIDEEKAKLELKKEFFRALERGINEKIKILERKLHERRKIELESAKLESKIKEKEYLEKEIEKTQIMITNKYETSATISNECHELETTIAESKEIFNETEYTEILNKINKKSETIEKLSTHYANLSGELNSLEKHQNDTLQKRERVFKIEICPTCLQDVPESHKHNILNETENLISEIKNKESFIEAEINSISQLLGKEKSEKLRLEEQKTSKGILKARTEYLEKAKKRLQTITTMRKNIEQDALLLNKHIISLKAKISDLSRYDIQFKRKKEELNTALLEERKAEITLAETKKECELTKSEISDLESSIEKKELTKKNLSNLLELYSWLSTNFLELVEFTERNILIKLRQEFSRIFAKWFHILVPYESLTVRLDDSFSPIILHNDIEMEYSFLSGGERTAIALAYRLALNQTINSLLSKIKTKNIVILDEPTDGFSEAQLERMRDVLQELNVAQLIIVSHEQKIESFVTNVIKIVKTGEVSQILSPNNHQTLSENAIAPSHPENPITVD